MKRAADGLATWVAQAALMAAVLFAVYYVNWTYGWITAEDLDFYN